MRKHLIQAAWGALVAIGLLAFFGVASLIGWGITTAYHWREWAGWTAGALTFVLVFAIIIGVADWEDGY